MSAFFEASRDQYYGRLQGITNEGDWSGWLEYFLEGVALQAEDVLSRAERINKKLAAWRAATAGFSSQTPLLLVEKLAANPFLTINKAAKELKIAYTTADRAVRHLEKNRE